MQASKIKIGEIVAIREDDKLLAMRVTKVITTRTGPHSSDHSHRIYGKVEGREEELHRSPEGVLGPFQEHAELVAKAEADKAAHEAEKAAKAAAAEELIVLLYSMTGLRRMSRDEDRYNSRNDFRDQYGREVVISAEAVPVLLEALRKKYFLRAV